MTPPGRLLSLAALTILDSGPIGQVHAAHTAGFTHAGLRLMPLLATDQDVICDAARRRELDRALDETGLQLLEIGVFPLKADMEWPRIEAVVRYAGGRGARFLVCPVEDADHTRAARTTARIAELATTVGMTACIEFNPYSACKTLASARELIEHAENRGAAPNSLGLCLDVLHLSRSGGSPDDLTPQAIDQIKLVHLCDAPPPPAGVRSIDELRAESRTARLLPGQGSLWLEDLLAKLPRSIPLSIEAPTRADQGMPASERARHALAATLTLVNER